MGSLDLFDVKSDSALDLWLAGVEPAWTLKKPVKFDSPSGTTLLDWSLPLQGPVPAAHPPDEQARNRQITCAPDGRWRLLRESA
jgi:hypothetical protein